MTTKNVGGDISPLQTLLEAKLNCIKNDDPVIFGHGDGYAWVQFTPLKSAELPDMELNDMEEGQAFLLLGADDDEEVDISLSPVGNGTFQLSISIV